jgi:DNA-binding NarL/FixJ family response regulator
MTLKILLADDNRAFVAAVRQYFDMLPGVEVIGTAHDGREALHQAALLAPDLVLLDVAMPEMTGLEVARQMLAWPRRPQVVFLSMHDSAAYQSAARTMGAAGFVGKANFVVDLLPLIDRMLEAGKPAQP